MMPFHRLVSIFVVLLTGLFTGLGVQAATVLLVLSEDSSVYQEAAGAIESEIDGNHKIIRVMVDQLDAVIADAVDAKLLIAIGVKAANQSSSRFVRVPILAVLIPRDWYQKGGRADLAGGGRNHGAIVLDQPYSRQLKLIKLASPDANKVGVLYSQGNAGQLSEIESAARTLRLLVNGTRVDSETSLVDALEKTLSDSDVLLAIPDSVVLNRNTVQSLFITSYRYRDPVIGYSKSLSRAGALVSLYSTPAQIGKQAGETAQRYLSGGKLPGMLWPKYFSISANTHVARSLDIDLPSEQQLLKELQEGGGND